MGKLLPRLKDKDLLGFGKSISRLRSVKRQPELDGSTTEKACASYESYLQRKGTKKLISQRQPGPHAASDISSDQLADPTHLLPTYTLRTLVRVELKLYRWNHRKVIQGAHNLYGFAVRERDLKQQRGLQQRSRKNILRPYSGPVRGDLRTWRVAPGPVRVPLEQMRGGPRTSARYPPDVGARAPWSRCAMTPGPVRDDPRTSAR
ncbi:conserved hypothetical protein [Coccidioides posadasii str. Silveira]|uniref:Uncharacterized protein n=1 Tax=Coccidioides posadasii (strain RMSCC 757 / Silveira) TaxID=443226 RepID=E9DK30_COCPS|nr:conserved hypothetical protein [Coccidioides posadasii str. Silveira]EFW13228.1 conserved hypothetical protein [Coccidioides posadasii str. Silveira]